MFGDGEFRQTGKKQDITNAGIGALLFANILDTWKIEDYDNGWPVPQNSILAQHQLGSLHSVGLFWYDQLKRGYHVHPNALDDEDPENQHVVANRAGLTIQKLGLESFEAALIRAQNAAFDATWRQRQAKNAKGELDWFTLCKRLSATFRRGPYSGQGPKIGIFFQVAQHPGTSRWKSYRKNLRATFWYDYYQQNSNWVVYLPKPKLYTLYTEESRQRRSGFRGSYPVSETEFWTILENTYCKKGHSSGITYHHIMATIPLPDQQSWQWHYSSNGGVGRPRKPRKAKVCYIELASLEACRKEFAVSMNWGESLEAEMWMEGSPIRDEFSLDEPWYWFGDKKSREMLDTKYG